MDRAVDEKHGARRQSACLKIVLIRDRRGRPVTANPHEAKGAEQLFRNQVQKSVPEDLARLADEKPDGWELLRIGRDPLHEVATVSRNLFGAQKMGDKSLTSGDTGHEYRMLVELGAKAVEVAVAADVPAIIRRAVAGDGFLEWRIALGTSRGALGDDTTLEILAIGL